MNVWIVARSAFIGGLLRRGLRAVAVVELSDRAVRDLRSSIFCDTSSPAAAGAAYTFDDLVLALRRATAGRTTADPRRPADPVRG